MYNNLRSRLHVDTIDTLIFIARIGPYLQEKNSFGDTQMLLAVKNWKADKKGENWAIN